MNEQQNQFFQMLKCLQKQSVLNTLQDCSQKSTEDMLYQVTFEMMNELLTYLDGYASDSCFHLVHRETGMPLKSNPFLELHDVMGKYLQFQSFPDMLDDAKVLEYTEVNNLSQFTVKDIRYLAICQYDNDAKFYLFYCDSDWTVVQDDCWDSAEECRKIAEEFGVTKWYKCI